MMGVITGLVSAVIRIPLNGQVFSSERAISGSVSPITSWWSSRTLVSTPMFERTIMRSLTSWYCGRSAMHSMTSACTVSSTYFFATSICSRMVGAAFRWITSSSPSRLITTASVPVALPMVTMLASRNMPAMMRVTVLFPRIPFTCTRRYRRPTRRRCCTDSIAQRASSPRLTTYPKITATGMEDSSAS